MTADNFERCLAVTLAWEGGYANHPDDPGGATMRGVTQGTYDEYMRALGKRRRPVRGITDAELRDIYRKNYWDACGCDALPTGLDLCVFDAAVNTGVGRARPWAAQYTTIDSYCDHRLAVFKSFGRLWRVFGAGWSRRIAGIRRQAHAMAGQAAAPAPDDDDTLVAGMTGGAVLRLQKRLRELGYPCGLVDGVYGEQTYRAVILFQTDHELEGDPGVWQPAYWEALKTAGPMLPKRKAADHTTLERSGDKPIQRMNLLQRLFAWIFGASAVAQLTTADGVLATLNTARGLFEPVMGLLSWASEHRWLLIATACVGIIALIRAIRAEHVEAFQNFDYQGQAPKGEKEAA